MELVFTFVGVCVGSPDVMHYLLTFIVHDIPSSQSARASLAHTNIDISNEVRMDAPVSTGPAVPARSLCKVNASRLSCVSRFEMSDALQFPS
jgi:hypothetical protein